MTSLFHATRWSWGGKRLENWRENNRSVSLSRKVLITQAIIAHYVIIDKWTNRVGPKQNTGHAPEATQPAEGTENPAGAGAPELPYPLFVKTVDWTGNTVQSILLADADDWIRGKLQGMTAQLSDYLRSPRVIVVGSVEDPAAGVWELTRAIMLECGTHHLIVTRNHEGRVTHIAFYREET